MKTGIITVKTNDIVSFEIIAPGTPGGDTGAGGGPSLRADFTDGHYVTPRVDEAVTLKSFWPPSGSGI